MRGLSLVAASGGPSSSRCAGLSLSPPLLFRSTGSRRAGSVIVAHGPSCSAACGILPDQGSNPCPLHWQADSQLLHHQGSPLTIVFECKREFQHGSTLCLCFVISYQKSSGSESYISLHLLNHSRKHLGNTLHLLKRGKLYFSGFGCYYLKRICYHLKYEPDSGCLHFVSQLRMHQSSNALMLPVRHIFVLIIYQRHN